MQGPLLMVDTSSFTGSVALIEGEKVLGEILLNVRATHSERLLGTIDRLLQDVDIGLAEVAAFGAVAGPGSFTGLRIGVATVKGLAMAMNKPLTSVTSLEALAMNAPHCRMPVCCLIDARKKEVYAGLYEWQGGLPSAIRPPAVMPPEQLLASLDNEVLFIGDGVEVYRNFILHQMREHAHFAPGGLNQVRASQAAFLASERLARQGAVTIENFLPVYLRPSDAEIMWAKRMEEGSIEG